jgi:hypothetical protein
MVYPSTMASNELISPVQKSTFACLSAPAKKNPLFDQVFPNINALIDVMATTVLDFCPGLLATLKSATPPNLAWMKGLPAIKVMVWGVYILVFEEKGYPPLVYCGSVTASRDG